VHSYRYRITIEGHLGKAGCAAFEEFSIASGNGHTSLVADLDQSALYGALIRIQSLGPASWTAASRAATPHV